MKNAKTTSAAAGATEHQRMTNVNELAHFTPKQQRAEELVWNFKYLLYGGAMAGGKSYFLRWMLIKILCLWYVQFGLENVTVALFCEDYPSLKDRHLSKIRYEFPTKLGTYNASDHNFVLNPQFGSNVIAFRNLDDPSKYQSSEFAAIAVDELTKNKKETFDFLRTRLRWPGIKHPKFIAATNPGGVGSAWVKDFWIDHKFPPEESEQDQFMYVPAKAADNPHITSDYMKTLESLPAQLRRAFLEGDWDIFQGQYFKEWRRDLNVIPPRMPLKHHKKYIWLDYGYAAPSAVYWAYVDEFGRAIVYRELYKTGLTYRELAKEISELTPADEKIEWWACDPAIWAKKGENDQQLSGADIIAQEWQLRRKELPFMIKGDNRRVPGWIVVREYLLPFTLPNESTSPRLLVGENCPNLIRTFPMLIFDERNPEDLDTNGEDHGADAVRYGLMSKPKPSPEVATGPGARAARLLNSTGAQRSQQDIDKDSYN